ncbi:MAG TPA: hypothetical protein PLL20_20685 [Phycisphaerae bacterium]|nr:hypothetical protein [Phycisphaerae bacterium]HRR86873.1 hypothetical protein [Phycisphaerae bacterium]
MNESGNQPPLTRPSLRYFMPYQQTAIGFFVVVACVAALILGVKWLLGDPS